MLPPKIDCGRWIPCGVIAAGELAEIAGKEAVPLDERARLLRMRAIAEMNVTRLTPQDRELMVQLRARRELLYRHAPGQLRD